MFKLSQTIGGHSGDVKAVRFTPRGVLSVSRDGTAQLGPDPVFELGVYLNSAAFEGETAFCGAQDGTIASTNLATGAALYFMGHEMNVCALDARFGRLISGSWDKTARVWDPTDPGAEPLVLRGHSQAVWGVLVWSQDEYLTAGADKLILMWKGGKVVRKFTGHTDAVRGLARVDKDRFVSCSNDGSLRVWRVRGQGEVSESQVLHGHSSFVYSVATLSGAAAAAQGDHSSAHSSSSGSAAFASGSAASLIISSGEDRTVRVWQSGPNGFRLVQTITLPCVSQWSVDVEVDGSAGGSGGSGSAGGASGDTLAATGSDPGNPSTSGAGVRFAVGSSDHQTRIFSTSPSSWADPSTLQQFQEAVASSSIGEDQVGKIDESQLKPASHLTRPGNEGEIALVKVNGAVEAHQFSGSEWQKVGQVVGKSSDGAKQTYNGKDYDYVFDVDIREGEPPLKLPFNNSDNPYAVAERFVAEHGLPAVYVEQVVQFLIQNSEATTAPGALGAGATATGAGAPYGTGAGTGSAGYGAGAGSGAPAAADTPAILRYSTPLSMISFQSAPLIRAFSTCASKHGDQIPIESLITSLPSSAGELLQTSLKTANKWGLEDMLSALDTLRLAIPQAQQVPFVAVASLLLSCLDEDVPKHALLATRGLANLLSRHDAREILQKNPQPFAQAFQMLAAFKVYTNPQQIALATLCLNGVLAGGDMGKHLVSFAPKLSDPEACYRMALAVGVLSVRDRSVAVQLRGWLKGLTEERSKAIERAVSEL